MRAAVNGRAGGLVPMMAAGRLAAVPRPMTNHKANWTRFTEETTPEIAWANKLKTDGNVAFKGRFQISVSPPRDGAVPVNGCRHFEHRHPPPTQNGLKVGRIEAS